MLRNYLSGTTGVLINILLAATAYNMKKWMRLKKKEILKLIFYWFFPNLYSARQILKPGEVSKKMD
jgi:hypothetical protein